MPRITIYTTGWCGYCALAKALLDERSLAYDEVDVGDDPAFRARLHGLTGGWTVPQVLIDGSPVGGYAELRRLDRDGRLGRLLEAA